MECRSLAQTVTDSLIAWIDLHFGLMFMDVNLSKRVLQLLLKAAILA